MPRTLVRDLRDHLGQTVTVCGWIHALRLQRAMQFVIVRDPTGLVQVTHRRGRAGDALEPVIESLTGNSAVAITGRVGDNPIVNLGGLELVPERVEILGHAEAPLPLDEHSGPEHRSDWRYLDVRLRPAARLVFDVQTTEPIRDYLNCFRYGCPPHGGFGMGLGRVLMVMLGLESIREATFLFRGPNRLTP